MPVGSGDRPVARIDTTVAHPARRYNYWLGGKDHFAADRASGDAIEAAFPTARRAALANRAFMGRAITYLARNVGIRQFIDIGTGLPAPGNPHEVAQAVDPTCRVVYVDNDPIVLAHARALLNSAPEGATAYIEADLRDYGMILRHPTLQRVLDLSQPVGLLLVAVLHFFTESDEPAEIVSGLVDELAPGSYLIMSHGTADHSPAGTAERILSGIRGGSIWPRGRKEISQFLDGLDVVPPGIVSTDEWRNDGDPDERLTPTEAATYCAVARIP
jgi:hypothetical protein